MASWKDRFNDEGSFRGVPFKIESHSLKGGRRKQDREFAQREIGNSEDLGKRLRNFTLEMFVIGDDYFAARDALLEAIESEGAGVLVHPYLGTKTVQPGGYSLTETITEGRIARFNVEFSEAGQIRFPDQAEDDLTATTQNADILIENSKNVFQEAFSVANQPAFVVQAAADNIGAAVDFMDEAVKKVTEPIANLTFAISNIKANVNDLIKRPGELADIISEMYQTLLDELENDPETSSRVLGQFNDIDDEFPVVVGETPSRVKQKGNQNATINFAKELALAGNAKAVVEIDFVSTQAALTKQREIVDGLDLQLEQADDDELFQSIKDVQTSITKALPRTGTTELIEITPVNTIPAIVIAYNEFENLDKENEIIQQNNIDHPGFVPGGEAIKVSAS
jgi:prophage DNA circulation protein